MLTAMRTIQNTDLLECNLSNEEASAIKKGLSSIPYDPYGGIDYMSSIRIAAYRCLPERILNILEQQKNPKNLAPFFVFNNLPIDDEVTGSPSFVETGRTFKSGNLSENIICAIGAILGEPYSIYFEGKELVNNLTPQKNSKNEYTGLGSEVELDLHNENAALKYMSLDDCSPAGMFLFGILRTLIA